MMPIMKIGLLILLLGFGPAGCGLDKLVNPPAQQGEEALDDFVLALRLGEFPAAARHLAAEHRRAFLEQFAALEKDLHIVDVRIREMTVTAEGRRADVSLEMDYFLLPSATVRTFRYDHTWIYFGGNDEQVAHYRIVTPFPRFP